MHRFLRLHRIAPCRLRLPQPRLLSEPPASKRAWPAWTSTLPAPQGSKAAPDRMAPELTVLAQAWSRWAPQTWLAPPQPPSETLRFPWALPPSWPPASTLCISPDRRAVLGHSGSVVPDLSPAPSGSGRSEEDVPWDSRGAAGRECSLECFAAMLPHLRNRTPSAPSPFHRIWRPS